MARGRRSGRKIDNLRWEVMGGTAAALAAGSVGVSILSSGASLPETVMRTRGNLLGYIDGAQAPGGLARVAVGLNVVPEGTGTTVLRLPFTDANDPSWFYHSVFFLGYEEGVIDVVDVPGITSFREIIDSKAMRRAGPDEEVQMVVEQSTVLAAISVNVVIGGRILLGF